MFVHQVIFHRREHIGTMWGWGAPQTLFSDSRNLVLSKDPVMSFENRRRCREKKVRARPPKEIKTIKPSLHLEPPSPVNGENTSLTCGAVKTIKAFCGV